VALGELAEQTRLVGQEQQDLQDLLEVMVPLQEHVVREMMVEMVEQAVQVEWEIVVQMAVTVVVDIVVEQFLLQQLN
jgi:hypothetical protein